ncbi:MAG: tetratricopeptide repeat protein [Verrucomicrobiia bacterium]
MGTTENNQNRAGSRVPALAIVLIILTVIAYLPAVAGKFIFDDYILIVGNRMVKAGDGLYRFWFTTEASAYYPLTSSLWWLEWRWWGANPLGYHVVNVLLHAANAVLVWIALKRLRVPGAWVAGLVFAIHPLNVATVAWISEQKNTLSMFFYTVAILLYLEFDETNRYRWYGLSLAAFLLALLSKTAVVMLPVVLLACVWWSHRTVRGRDILYSVPFFILSMVMGLVHVWFEYHRLMGGHPVRTVGFPFRLATAGWVPWFYLYKALLPVNLMVIYPKWEVDPSRWVSYVPGVILIGALTSFWWKRNRWGRPLLFGLGYFVVTLFPVMGFFDQGFYRNSLVADHWQYYAIVAPIALVVAAGGLIWRRLGERGRSWGATAGMALLLLLGVGTWRRSRVYADEESLWKDNVEKNPNAWMAHISLADVLARTGRAPEAVAHYEQALRIEPEWGQGHFNLGVTLAQLGRLDEAIGQYEQALRTEPDMVEAHNNLGTALRQMGRLDEAIAQYEQAIRIQPDFAGAHINLGNALAQAGKLDEAIGHYEQAARIRPDAALTHFYLGNTLSRAGRVKDAITQYEETLRLDPGFTQAKANLARLQAVK